MEVLDLRGAWAARPPRAWQGPALRAIADALRDGVEGPLVEAIMGAGKSTLIAEVCRAAIAQDPTARVVVSTPTRALVTQLAETIAGVCGARRVGRYYSDCKQASRPITVTCYPSVEAMMAADTRPVALWICDEAHKTESPREIASAEAMGAQRRLALTATPYRAGTEGLSLWRTQIVRYGLADALADGVLTPWDTVGWDGSEADELDVMVEMLRGARGPGVIDSASIEDAEAKADALRAAGYRAAVVHSRLGSGVYERRIADLRSGELQMIVHVSMLVEGVDMPWLRWLYLSRRVKSRVRFLQQLGRVIRSHPGKDRAVIYDPWGLCEAFDLSYAATLGGSPEDEKEAPTPKDEEAWDLIDLPPMDVSPVMVPGATARRAISAWSRRLLYAAQTAGIQEPTEWDAEAASWRRRTASSAQVAALGRMAWACRWVRTPEAKAGMKAVLAQPHHITAGAASDLLSVLHASATYGTAKGRGWTSHLPIPPIPARVLRGMET